MTRWAHVSQVPEIVRQVLTSHLERIRLEEEVMVDRSGCRPLVQKYLLVSRAPELCHLAQATDPLLSLRQTFHAVALVTGLSEGHVRRLYYARRNHENSCFG